MKKTRKKRDNSKSDQKLLMYLLTLYNRCSGWKVSKDVFEGGFIKNKKGVTVHVSLAQFCGVNKAYSRACFLENNLMESREIEGKKRITEVSWVGRKPDLEMVEQLKAWHQYRLEEGRKAKEAAQTVVETTEEVVEETSSQVLEVDLTEEVTLEAVLAELREVKGVVLNCQTMLNQLFNVPTKNDTQD